MDGTDDVNGASSEKRKGRIGRGRRTKRKEDMATCALADMLTCRFYTSHDILDSERRIATSTHSTRLNYRQQLQFASFTHYHASRARRENDGGATSAPPTTSSPACILGSGGDRCIALIFASSLRILLGAGAEIVAATCRLCWM